MRGTGGVAGAPTPGGAVRCGYSVYDAALQRRLGVTTVYVTHDQVEAMTMGDRVALLADGQLQQFATPADDDLHLFHPGSGERL